jgi:hypothetical protein
MHAFGVLALGLLAVACGGGDGGGERDSAGPGPDASADFGAWDAASDAAPGDPGPQADPGPGDDANDVATTDDGGLQPLDIPTDLPKGDGAFGEPCASGSDCQSGLCFSTSAAAGCTVPCDAHADCAEWGLVCQWLSGGVRGCVPPPFSVAIPCTDSSACPFPTLCRTDLGQCEMGPCTWNGDCGEGQACEPVVHVCKPAVCQGDPECKNPRLVCREGQCVLPECSSDAPCGAGQYCQSGACQVADPCSSEGTCAYNMTCVEGLCVFNPCFAPCQHAGDVCDAATGKCGAPCTSVAACGVGKTCLAGGVCVANGAPYAAARFVLGDQLLPVGDVGIGPAVPLDGSLSFDPNGDALTYRWVVNAVPFGSLGAPGTALGASSTASFTPDVPGLYAFGLWVTDAAGAVSAQDQVVVRVW